MQTVPPQLGGENFLVRRAFFFLLKNGGNSETKSRRIDPKVSNQPTYQGLRAIDNIRGPVAKNRFSGRNQNFWAQKEHSLLGRNHVLATNGQSYAKKEVPFSQISISLLADFGCFLEKKKNRIFSLFSAFRQNVKTAASP